MIFLNMIYCFQIHWNVNVGNEKHKSLILEKYNKKIEKREKPLNK